MTKEYFPHDYCARLSLRGIRKDHGLEGLGFYWCFVEMLHEEGGYIKEDELENIAYDLQVKPELCIAVVKNYDLFTVKKGKIYSERVLRNIKKRAEVSSARKKAAEQRWSGTGEVNQDDEGGEPEFTPQALEREKQTREAQDYLGIAEEDKPQQEIDFYMHSLKNHLEIYEEESYNEQDAFWSISTNCTTVRQLIENIVEEIQTKKSLKINGKDVRLADFLQALIGLLRNKETRAAMENAIAEVNEKYTLGVIKNKQNYLISALYNTAKMLGE